MIIIHGASMSPFVRKTLAIAHEKGIEFEHRVGDFGNPSQDFLAASPVRKIPALTHDDYVLADSSAIIHYLDALHPEPCMIPSEPRARGKAIWWDEYADTHLIANAMGPIFFNRFVAPNFLGRPGDLAAAERAEAEALPPMLDYLESVVTGDGFLVEDRFTLADAAIASPFVNLGHLGIRPDPATYPRLSAYLAAIHARPSFAGYIAGESRFVAKMAR
jgi:glutathione S-transferase